VSWQLFAVIALLAVPAALAAQPFAEYTGQRVRLHYPVVGQFKGVLVAATVATLVVDTFDLHATQRRFNPATVTTAEYRRTTLMPSGVVQLDVSEGRSRARGVVRGMLWGTFAGAAYVGLMSVNGRASAQVDHFVQGARSGAVPGAVVGGLIGSAFPREQWRRVWRRSNEQRGGRR
jgi:hypothetical protein